MNHLIRISAILILAASLAACSTHQQTGAGVGAATGAGVGALIGQAIGHNTKSTVLGAGIGAVVGGIAGNLIGSYMDQQEQQLRQVDGANIHRNQDILTATFESDFLFDFDSANLKSNASSELERVANVLINYPQTTILVNGHTDAQGTVEYNQKLSERRALTVKNALVKRGVDPRRINAVGYGKSQPISSSDAANRRVEIIITPISQS
ncbi:MAG: OmpA family protein [Candidatus Adiutrix sp.]|jgi:outer membrane protein OmpA-like peptidoglycan-associated protein|nr:OmpA family protein [Candidatus Adiutrix sp.]